MTDLREEAAGAARASIDYSAGDGQPHRQEPFAASRSNTSRRTAIPRLIVHRLDPRAGRTTGKDARSHVPR
jgi:hypothetical protein